jgi:hypothetical protein
MEKRMQKKISLKGIITKNKELKEENFVEYTKDNLILKATIKVLVKQLSERSVGYKQPFERIFFLTYLSFSTCEVVLKEIQNLFFNIINDKNGILILLKNIGFWIKNHFEDFNENIISSLIYLLVFDLLFLLKR